ncbi:MAG: hypothetical protein AB1724_05075 [Thermodesulfobacteriota bacterium]
MFPFLPKLYNFPFFIVFFISISSAFASQQTPMVPDPAANKIEKATVEDAALKTEKGLLMWDYERIPVPDNESFDLLGFHYLHQTNNWLFLGFGVHAPLVDGNCGGFMAVDGTVHAQRKIWRNSFVDAGVSLGGGGGGSSIEQSKELSGKGGYIKSYAGLGYDFRAFSLGINYAHFQFMDSSINHSQFDFFIQKPISFSLSPYAFSGKKSAFDLSLPESREKILTFELNNLFQIQPEGSNTETINTLSLQFTRFLNEKYYLFLAGDVGYYGLPLYNQLVGGIGYKYSISPRVHLYHQIGAGSGGYSPDIIDTGSGLLVYPKCSAEYLLNNHMGLSVSGGYLLAPEGSSRNLTLGAAINYHLSTTGHIPDQFRLDRVLTFRGFRLNAFQQTEFNVKFGDDRLDDINLLSFQLDSLVNDNWYVPVQVSVAYNDFLGYPGYGELLTGLGRQNKFTETNRFQGFCQVLVGVNVLSILLKPSIGINYSLSDNLAIYAQIGKTLSVYKLSLHSNIDVDNERLDANHIGIGLTYRFSVLDIL